MVYNFIMKINNKGQYIKNTSQDFWARVDKKDSNQCWNWLGNIHKKSGYGAYCSNYKSFTAHRYSYILAFGEILNNLCVLHKCDNRKCVNPNHLFLGNRHDNAIDMVNKHRGLHGSRHPSSKLNEEKVLEIRRLYKTQHLSYQKLSNRFGVCETMIGFIIKRVKWKHI